MLEEAFSQSITQWIALVSGIIYVVLAARERPLCWLFGIVSCLCIAWDDFFSFQLYADGVLQIVYVGLGFVGLYKWGFGSKNLPESTIAEHAITRHLIVIGSSILLSAPVSYVLLTYTDAAFGFIDVLTTILSLYATWLLINKILSNWLYWIAIDAVYVFLFFRTGGTLVAVLYAVYFAVAIYGYIKWSKKMRENIFQPKHNIPTGSSTP